MTPTLTIEVVGGRGRLVGRSGRTRALLGVEPAAAEGESSARLERKNRVTVLEQKPLNLSVPLREDPAGVLRVGDSRVLLELVIRAYQRGASPQDILQMYDGLALGDVFTVIAYYLAHPAEIDEYLRKCDEDAEAVRRKIEASQPPTPTKEELLARANLKGLNL
jgi:uncharacterized protein (DUF433 family)